MSLRTLRARWVLPMAADSHGSRAGFIEDGEVVVEDGLIVEVRQATTPHDPASEDDFGNAVIIPGLVNAHTHLEYTVMRGLLEDIAFFPWIRELTARKATLDDLDWSASAVIGAAEAVAAGVTTIGDCTDSGAAMIGAKTLGLRGTIYQEVFGIDGRTPIAEIIKELDIKLRALRWSATGSRLKVGISPHAPYTVAGDLFKACAAFSTEHHAPMCIHAAESQAECALIQNGTGPIAQMYHRREIDWIPPGGTTVGYLDQLGALSPNTLLVHGVQFAAEDREVVRRTGAAWVHCPKSNAKLANGVAPLHLLRESYDPGEARVGLGSDSVASNNTVDMFEEMRFAVLMQRAAGRTYDALTAREVVEMATIGSARALGMENQIGSIEVDKKADFTVVSLDHLASQPVYDPFNALVYAASARDVRATYIDGEPAYRDGQFLQVDITNWQEHFVSAANKMRAWTPEH